MASSRDAATDDTGRRRRRGRGFGSILLAFLLGVLLTAAAAVVLVLLDVVDLDGAPTAGPTSTTSPEPAAEGSQDVPEPCLRAAEYNATFTEALDDLALGIRDQDARRMQEALDAIQDAQPGSEDASAQCRALAGEEATTAPEDDDATSSPEPSPTESASDEASASPSPTRTP